MNYSVKQKTPLKEGCFHTRLGLIIEIKGSVCYYKNHSFIDEKSTKYTPIFSQITYSFRRKKVNFTTNQYWMVMGILGLSGENVNINFPFVIINNKVILKVSI